MHSDLTLLTGDWLTVAHQLFRAYRLRTITLLI
jgi:hypothetical protein